MTVVVDTREKYPLLFPANMKVAPLSGTASVVRVLIQRAALTTGDYAIQSFEDRVLVERKASVDELHSNLCTADWPRFKRELERLQKCPYPVLFLDFSPQELVVPTVRVSDPAVVATRLMEIVVQYRLSLWWAGQCRTNRTRIQLGEQLVRFMLAATRQVSREVAVPNIDPLSKCVEHENLRHLSPDVHAHVPPRNPVQV